MKAADFDRKFDENEEDIIEDLDFTQAKRPGQKKKQINVDFPTWMIEALDREAARIGMTRQSVIQVWIAERLERAHGQ